MAIFHAATNTPPKSDIIGAWIADQSWGPPASVPIELVASFHLDDPEGEVGMQVFAVKAGDKLFQVPLTYRATKPTELAGAFMGTMQHSVLGPRHVHDGMRDERFLTVLAGVAANGYGQALGFAQHDGRWYAWSDEMLLRGTGALAGRPALDGFDLAHATAEAAVAHNDSIELTLWRRLTDRPQPSVGLTATWADQRDPVTLAQVRAR